MNQKPLKLAEIESRIKALGGSYSWTKWHGGEARFYELNHPSLVDIQAVTSELYRFRKTCTFIILGMEQEA